MTGFWDDHLHIAKELWYGRQVRPGVKAADPWVRWYLAAYSKSAYSSMKTPFGQGNRVTGTTLRRFKFCRKYAA